MVYLTHGMSRTSIYKVWADMVNRCTNKKLKCYPRYGGRGIKVHPEWRESFEAFLRDVPPRPSPKHQLDREKNDGHYEPGNVRWVTGKQNCRNARHNRLIEYQGRMMPVAEAAELSGVNNKTILYRLRTGDPDLFRPAKVYNR